MVADGLFDRTGGRPDVVLGQHVMPLPVGVVNLTAGPAMAATDSFRVTLHGRGGHGSSPESTVDPVVMAAATVMRLQGVVSREVGARESAVVTVGALRAGTQANIIPGSAELLVNVRSFTPTVRRRVLDAIHRIVDAEAAASRAPQAPEYEEVSTFDLMVNDPAATERTRAVLARTLDEQHDRITAAGGRAAVVSLPPLPGSEDVGDLATAAGVPLVYWNLGGFDPALFAAFDLSTATGMGNLPDGVAPNHSRTSRPSRADARPGRRAPRRRGARLAARRVTSSRATGVCARGAAAPPRNEPGLYLGGPGLYLVRWGAPSVSGGPGVRRRRGQADFSRGVRARAGVVRGTIVGLTLSSTTSRVITTRSTSSRDGTSNITCCNTSSMIARNPAPPSHATTPAPRPPRPHPR